MHGMLKQAGIVAHRKKVAQLHVRRRRAVRDRDRPRTRDHLEPVTLARMLKRGEVTLGRAFPCHRSADGVGALAHRLPAGGIGEQACYFLADRRGIAERNDDATAVIQQLQRVPVGGRNHGLAQSEAVGKRARSHLRLVEVRRDIDVAHRNKFQQRRLIDELVEEYDVVLAAKVAHAVHQALAIGLALVADQIGMRRAEHDVDRVRPALQDRRHGVDHDLDALAGGEQTERQNDRTVAEAQFGLCGVGLHKRKVGYAVGDDLDLVVRHAIDAAQHLASLVGHHDNLRGRLDEPFHHGALGGARLGQHRVQRCNDRHFEP